MLSGLSSLLFGSGGTDDAAVDQTLASQAHPLDTQDADNGWVLVDVTDNSQAEQQPSELPDSRLETAIPEREMEVDEQAENRPRGGPDGHAVQQRHHQRAARAVRADTVETQHVKLFHSKQLQQQKTVGKQLSKKYLQASNKARIVQSSGRKPASARSRVLRPSGRMNGRQPQRQY